MDQRIRRDEHEFARTLSFFDATFALAMTLLVTTIDPGDDAFASWQTLWDSVGSQVAAFAVSFAVVGVYWWSNHRFIGSLKSLSPRLILLNVVMLGFVALVPFTTEALGDPGAEQTEIATVVYATNVAVISILTSVLYVVAWRDRLFRDPPPVAGVKVTLVDQSVATVVFLLSIPVALVVSGEAARLSWLSLVVLGPVVGGWADRRRRALGLDDVELREEL